MLLALLQDLPDAASGWGDLVAPIGGLAFAALLLRLAIGQADKRAAVAESRENAANLREATCMEKQETILEDNRSQASTIKDQSLTLLRVATLAESAVQGITVTHQKVDALYDRVDQALDHAR